MALANDQPPANGTGIMQGLAREVGGLYDRSPQILVNEPARLVIEEPHASGRTLLILGLSLPLLFIVPMLYKGGILGLLLGVPIGLIVLGMPFLILAALKFHRRLEIDFGAQVLVRSIVFYFFPRRVRTFPFAEIDCLTIELRTTYFRDTASMDTLTPVEHMHFVVCTRCGSRYTALKGGVAPGIVAVLKERLAGHIVIKDGT